GVNIMRPRLRFEETSSRTRRIARSSDWPCLQGENDGQVQCWEFESQLALLSMRMTTFGFCALLPVPVNRSMSSPRAGMPSPAMARAAMERRKTLDFTKPPEKGLRAVGCHVQGFHADGDALCRCHVDGRGRRGRAGVECICGDFPHGARAERVAGSGGAGDAEGALRLRGHARQVLARRREVELAD